MTPREEELWLCGQPDAVVQTIADAGEYAKRAWMPHANSAALLDVMDIACELQIIVAMFPVPPSVALRPGRMMHGCRVVSSWYRKAIDGAKARMSKERGA